MRTIAMVLLLGGCATAHSRDDVGSGLYDLNIEGEIDACSPARPSGAMGTVAVVVNDGAIDAPVPDFATAPLLAPRVLLTPDRAFHSETNRRVPDCDGAWVHEEWTVIDAAREGFDLLHLQEWQGLASCLDPSASMPGAPSADCRSERLLRYGLAQSCPSPCALTITNVDTIECVCD